MFRMLLLIIVFGTFVGAEPTENNFGYLDQTEVKSCFYYNEVTKMDKTEFLERFQKLLKDQMNEKPDYKPYFWQRIQNYVHERYGKDLEAPYDWKDLSKDEFITKFDTHYQMHLNSTKSIWLEAGKKFDLEPSPCTFKQFNNEDGTSLQYITKSEAGFLIPHVGVILGWFTSHVEEILMEAFEIVAKYSSGPSNCQKYRICLPLTEFGTLI